MQSLHHVDWHALEWALAAGTAWELHAGAELRRIAITVEAQGFRILRLRQVG